MMDLTIYSNVTDISPHVHPSFGVNVAVTVVIATFWFVGVSGSCLTAIVIGKTQSCHTKANMFIFSLCVSDLISGLISSPLWLYRRAWGFEYWALDHYVCNLYWVIDFSTNYVTSLHIASFSALRYVAIKWPLAVLKLSKTVVVFYLFSLWTVSVIFALPLWYLMGVDAERDSANVGSCWPSCSIASKGNDCCVTQFNDYIIIINSLFFYFPQFLIIIFSFLIYWEIRKSIRLRDSYFNRVSSYQTPPINAKQSIKRSSCYTVTEKLDRNPKISQVSTQSLQRNLFRKETGSKEKGAFLQLFLIIITYAVGYIPTTIYLQWATSVPSSHYKAEIDYWFGLFSYLSLRFSECMNPFMYNLGSSNLRQATKTFLKKLCCRT